MDRVGLPRSAPGLIVGAILVAALLHTSIADAAADRASPAPTPRPPVARVLAPPPAPASVQPPASAATPVPATTPAVPLARTGRVVDPTAAPTHRAIPTAIPRPRPTVTPRPAARATPRPTPKATPRPAPRATPRPIARATPKPTPRIVYTNKASGRAAWGHLGGRVVTRLPAGTRIKVCGRRGCWQGVSYGYGPAASTGYLVDLDKSIFQRICGPLSIGVDAITLSWR